MGRLLPIVSRQKISLFILACCFNCLSAASLTIEERLQALEATNIEIKSILAIKSDRIKALEIEVEQLKVTVVELIREKELTKKNVGITITEPTYKTCREIQLADPSLPSGLYWIDPDGQGVGDDPIQVHCDMVTGSTLVLHESESPINVGHCDGPGCYSREINYSASKRQMIALAELSSECHQSIRYDCNLAPFESNGVAYSWWNDRLGSPQYFWAGSNSNVHTCQCGIDQNCVEQTLSCNCNSNLHMPQFDNGVITNKNLLPVSQLNFGQTLHEMSFGVITLGPFSCSGQVFVNNGLPSSCADLWRIGHTLNGLYSVMGTKMIETVYCDFKKLPNESGFQTSVGYGKVKSLPTYFSVQRSTNFSVVNTSMSYDIERLNVGGAMDKTTGIFTATRKGSYFFSFSGVVRRTSTSWSYLVLALKLNGNHVVLSRTHGPYAIESISLQSTLSLQAGDQVWLQIDSLDHAYLFDENGGNSIQFTGWLLQEDGHHLQVNSN